MKIALVAPAPIPARTANSIQVMKMALALAGLGHELRVYLPGLSPDVSHEELARHYGLNLREGRLPFDLNWLPAIPWLRRYDYGWHGLRAARRWKADLLYTRLHQAAAFASWLNFPTIFEIHDVPGGGMGPRLFRAFLSGRGARRLVVITQALAIDLKAHYSAPDSPPFTVIAPDGVDLERYANLPEPSQARNELGLPERFTAGYTGHLYEGRGVELLLSLARHLPEIGFLLAGGEEKDVARVREQAQDAGLHNLTLTGFVPNAELPRYQAACDVLLMPYQARVAASSGGDIAPYLSPMKMFEYLAAERPILASDLPVLAEVLNADNAILLPPRDNDAWTAALEKLHANPSLRVQLAESARRTAEEHTWEKRAGRIMKGLGDLDP